jgi:hypothetical protein
MWKRSSEKKTANWEIFEVAPDFIGGGGIYKPINQNNKRFEVIKDTSIPF